MPEISPAALTAGLSIIGHVHTPFAEKFGIPRQSGLVADLPGEIVFCPEYRVPEAVRGLEEFDRIWIIWQFSRAVRDSWSPTVRPPRLGGNRRMGVFATRSPFRPNPIGLSCVRLTGVELTADRGPVLHISGADLMDGTPVFDIKPYIPYADSYPDAAAGFASEKPEARLQVALPADAAQAMGSTQMAEALAEVLAQDPRPRYQDDPQRVYGLTFGGREVKFTVAGDALTVTQIEQTPSAEGQKTLHSTH